MKRTRVQVEMPESVRTFDEETEYLMREYGLGRIDHDEDAPPIEDCAELFEFEVVRKGGK